MSSMSISSNGRATSEISFLRFVGKPETTNADADVAGVLSLVRIVKNARVLMALELAELGLHSGQDHLLMALREGASITVGHLAGKLGVRPSTVSKMVDRLAAAGMIERSGSGSDARQTMITCTQAGVEMRERVRQAWLDTDALLFHGMANDAAHDLRHAVNELDELLQQRVKRLR